jgi:cytochrome P450
VCIGQHFALLEMGLAAAMLLQRYELQMLPGSRPPEPAFSVTLRPAGPLKLRLVRRPNATQAQPQALD